MNNQVALPAIKLIKKGWDRRRVRKRKGKERDREEEKKFIKKGKLRI